VVRNVKSPPHIQQIVTKLISGIAKGAIVTRKQIQAADLKLLDAYACTVFANDDCELLSYEGCNSCCADGLSGSLAHTTCGDWCDQVCGEEPCH